VEQFFGIFQQIKDLNLPKTQVLPPFEGVYASFYADSFQRFEGDIEWYLEHMSEGRGKVLDLGCGSGRTAIPFARAGHSVTGVDLSKDMLKEGRSKIKAVHPEINANITLIEGDARILDLRRTFDYTVIGGLTIPLLLKSEERRLVLATARRHLRPGGVMLFDYLPTIPGEQQSESYFIIPAATPEMRGFVLLGCHRNPGENYQVTNLYTELVTPVGKTRRFLSNTVCTVLDANELCDELTELGFEIVDSKDIVGTKDKAAHALSTQNWPMRLVACRVVS
jgi:ubiquinone/menaquinone biosynthesis C-methylase UbiE